MTWMTPMIIYDNDDDNDDVDVDILYDVDNDDIDLNDDDACDNTFESRFILMAPKWL